MRGLSSASTAPVDIVKCGGPPAAHRNQICTVTGDRGMSGGSGVDRITSRSAMSLNNKYRGPCPASSDAHPFRSIMSSTSSQPPTPSLLIGRLCVDAGDDRHPRTFNVPVVVSNPHRRQLVLRMCFGNVAVPTTIYNIHDAQDMAGTPAFLLGHQLAATYGSDPSNVVLLVRAQEPQAFPLPTQTVDGRLPIYIEVFEKPGDRHLCSAMLDKVVCPAARIASVHRQASASPQLQVLPHALNAPEMPVPSPPELLPSSSSSASSSESASPPDFTTLEPPFTPEVTPCAISPANATGGDGPDEAMTFIRTTLVPTKAYHVPALLRLKGELMDMTRGWNDEEDAMCRRLVRFDSRLQGPEVHVNFWAISQADYAAVPNVKGTTVISCIHDPSRDDYVVTSVDILHLLEVILYAEFGIDERNRIRRNLEGLRPKSISKSQPDTESLFSLIMEFPYPKPRSIEKSLKVFRWSTLSSALNKIIDKFSAVDLAGPSAGHSSARSPRHVRGSDGAVGPYPPRSSSKAPPPRTTRRNARSPHFIHVPSPSPELLSSSSDEQEMRGVAASFGPGDSFAGGPAGPSFEPRTVEMRTPTLVQGHDDDDRARVPSVNLPLPSHNSPPLPQDAVTFAMPSGERPRNASLDQEMLMPLPPFAHEVAQMSRTYDFDDQASIVEASTIASAQMDIGGLGLYAPRVSSDMWRSLSWSSDTSFGPPDRKSVV